MEEEIQDDKINFENLISEEADSDDYSADSIYDPFGEKFNSEDVVNKTKKFELDQEYQEDDFSLTEESDMLVSEENLEDILSESEQQRLKRDFKSEFEIHSDINTDNKSFNDQAVKSQETLSQDFKDFLILPRISGTMGGSSDSNIIQGNCIAEQVAFDEIVDTFDDNSNTNIDNDGKHTRSTIISHKNMDGIITSLEVVCVCGRKTVVKLDYALETDSD